MQPIGVFHSCYPQKFGTPRQPGLVPESTGFIEIYPQFQPQYSLEGLETFSHLWVIFHFHEVKDFQFRAKVHPPLLDGETMGVFATRSPHRPNQIGLSLVKLASIDKNGVHVNEVDIIDGTPVFDIKPYLPEFESKPAARMGWAEAPGKTRQYPVTWTEGAKNSTLSFEKERKLTALMSLIENTVRHDPRPLAFRKPNAENKQYRTNHYVRIHDLDVGFYFTENDQIVIDQVITHRN